MPLLVQMGAWGRRHMPAVDPLLEEGGAPMWEAFMAELRCLHLCAPAPGRSVFAELRTAFAVAVARREAMV